MMRTEKEIRALLRDMRSRLARPCSCPVCTVPLFTGTDVLRSAARALEFALGDNDPDYERLVEDLAALEAGYR